jgi:dGTPase
MHSRDSRGRKYPEPEHSYRGPYQRDRDRIIHSHAFRRLAYKMQVFTGDMGDYHRTRLTHTHEVASIARTIGRALRLNEDLIEALALFHDIGHPPYGHSGEDALNECLAPFGGFSHNQMALTIAEELEVRYPAFPGLNLTYEVLEGQATRVVGRASQPVTQRRRNLAGSRPQDRGPPEAPLLEVQVVEAADSITYNAHDADDAVKLGLVTLPELAQNSLVREAIVATQRQYAALDGDMLRKCIVHELIDRQVTDVLSAAGQFLAGCQGMTAAEVCRLPFHVGPSRELAEQKQELEQFLYDRVYRHERLIAVRSQAQERIKVMFCGYLSRPELIPPHHRRRIGTLRSRHTPCPLPCKPLPVGEEVPGHGEDRPHCSDDADRTAAAAPPALLTLEQVAADYIAGMTDRFCDAVYEKYFANK